MVGSSPEGLARDRIDRLLENADWDSSQIRVEERVTDGRLDYRLDDLCILEAKAPDGSGDPSKLRIHLQQAQRYQRDLEVPFVMVSDGELHFIQDLRDRKITRLYFLPTKVQLQTLLSDPSALQDGYISDNRGLLDYQKEALGIALGALVENRPRMLIEMATGTGKTRVAAEILAAADRLILDREGRHLSALFLVDRDSLEEQSLEKLERDLEGLKVNSIENLGKARIDVLVAQIATLQNRFLGSPFHADYFDLIVVDEAHRSVHGATWRQSLEHFNCTQIGLTATPPRLGDDETIAYFGEPAFRFPYHDAVRRGYLAPYVIHRVKTNIDKNGLNLDGILFDSSQFGVSVEIENRDREIVRYYIDHFYGRKCLLFAASGRHAASMWRIFNEEFATRDEKYTAEVVLSAVDSASARSATVQRFQDGRSDLKVLVNLNILTAGFDYPDLDLLFMCRQTRHKSLYLQMKGRGARVPRDNFGKAIVGTDGLPVKDRFTMADFVGVTDWEHREGVSAVPVASGTEADDLPTSDEGYEETREPNTVLVADVPVEISEVEIISPFDLGGGVDVSAAKAELAELRAELSIHRVLVQREAGEVATLRRQLVNSEEQRRAEQRDSFRLLIQALSRALPLARLDEDLLRRAAPGAPSLEQLNHAFDLSCRSTQEIIDLLLAEPIRKRYRDLVDTKAARSLSTLEAIELEDLDRQLEELEKPFYTPIIEALQARLSTQRRD